MILVANSVQEQRNWMGLNILCHEDELYYIKSKGC